MNAFKNNKTHLDDFFAEARANQNIAPAENLLQRTIPENSFKNGFMKIGFAGVVAVTAFSFFLLKDDGFKSENAVLKTKSDVFKKEIVRESAAIIPDLKNSGNQVLKSNQVVFKKEISVKNSFKKEQIKQENLVPQQTPENMQLTSIPLVELQDFELRKLGIEVLKDGDVQLTYAPNNDTVHLVHQITERKLSKEEEKLLLQGLNYRFVSRDEHIQINPPQFTPKKITNLNGTVTYFTSSNEKDRSTSNNDIPPDLLDFFKNGSQRTLTADLKVKLQEWSSKQFEMRDSIDKAQKFIPVKAGNFIAWFRPDDEVLKALPERVCNSIHAELTGNNVVSAEEFGEEYPTSGFCYLDLCEKTNGAIVCSKVSPNPAPDKRTTLSYELSEERGIVTALYDLSGRKLREFCALTVQPKGKHDEEISLDGIEKGIYLIAIITDKGEKLSRRLIID